MAVRAVVRFIKWLWRQLFGRRYGIAYALDDVMYYNDWYPQDKPLPILDQPLFRTARGARSYLRYFCEQNETRYPVLPSKVVRVR